jgi:hypothetical protein
VRSCFALSLFCFALLAPSRVLAEGSTRSDARSSAAALDLPRANSPGFDLPRLLRGSSLVLVFHYPGDESVVRQAVALWQSCRKIGIGLPAPVAFDGSLLVADPLAWNALGDRRIDVTVADTSEDRRCGSFRGNQIQVFRRARKRAGGVRSCGSLGQNLAHEIGHSFGLDDHPRDLHWQHHIMSRLHPGNLFSRRVDDSECDAVDVLWQTDHEASSIGVRSPSHQPIR